MKDVMPPPVATGGPASRRVRYCDAPRLADDDHSARHAETQPADDVELAAAWLTGDFTSTEQAEEDPRHFAIELHVRPIWRARDDAPWLYVEQAAAGSVDRPYRQRIYRIEATDDGVASIICALPGDPLGFAGMYEMPEASDELSPDDLLLREGCTVFLTRDGDSFVGSTRGEGCSSSLRRATYATSAVTMQADRLESWSGGYDEAGEQVWGAETGPYVFLRVD
jgi:hypothetical protein